MRKMIMAMVLVLTACGKTPTCDDPAVLGLVQKIYKDNTNPDLGKFLYGLNFEIDSTRWNLSDVVMTGRNIEPSYVSCEAEVNVSNNGKILNTYRNAYTVQYTEDGKLFVTVKK